MIYVLLRVADLLLVLNYHYYYYHHPHPQSVTRTIHCNFDWLAGSTQHNNKSLQKTDFPLYNSQVQSLRFMPQLPELQIRWARGGGGWLTVTQQMNTSRKIESLTRIIQTDRHEPKTTECSACMSRIGGFVESSSAASPGWRQSVSQSDDG